MPIAWLQHFSVVQRVCVGPQWTGQLLTTISYQPRGPGQTKTSDTRYSFYRFQTFAQYCIKILRQTKEFSVLWRKFSLQRPAGSSGSTELTITRALDRFRQQISARHGIPRDLVSSGLTANFVTRHPQNDAKSGHKGTGIDIRISQQTAS